MKKIASALTVLALILISSSLPAQNLNAIYYDRQEIVVDDFCADGFVLDIGVGGEGVIGQLKGNQVISIDPLNRVFRSTIDLKTKIFYIWLKFNPKK